MRILSPVNSGTAAARSMTSCLNFSAKANLRLPTGLPSHKTPFPPSINSTRPFSTSPFLSSSPFRLSSTPTATTTTATTPDHIPDLDDPNDPYSAYKPKRQWPPDMSKLSPKHQFRLERKYRRRAALKYARPKWAKATKLIQWGSIGFVLLYALLFMEWDAGVSPFDEIRKTVFASIQGAFSAPPPATSMRRSDDSTRG